MLLSSHVIRGDWICVGVYVWGYISYRLKRHSGPGRGLGEDHRHGLSLEGLEVLIAGVEALLGIHPLVQHVLRLVMEGPDVQWAADGMMDASSM